MNGAQLAKLLKQAKTSAAIWDAIRACDTRRAECSERIRKLDNGGWYSRDPAERANAIEQGPEAVAGLAAEIQTLQKEIEWLDRASWLASERARELERVEAAKALTSALERLPDDITAILTAAADLDKAIARHRVTVEAIAHYEKVGATFPLADSVASALLDVRDVVWRKRTVAVLIPNNRETLPLAWSKYYEMSPLGASVERARMEVRQ